MLNYELAVKAILGEHRDWTADVWVAATVDERMILGPKDKPVVVPIGKWIDYHVMFRTPDGVVAPIVLAFDPTNHLARELVGRGHPRAHGLFGDRTTAEQPGQVAAEEVSLPIPE